MTTIKVHDIVAAGETRRRSAQSIATDYRALILPLGNQIPEYLIGAGIPDEKAYGIASGIQTKVRDLVTAYEEVGAMILDLTVMIDAMTREVNRSRGMVGFILD